MVSSEELIERSDKLLHQGQLEEALELANAAAESLPSDGSHHFAVDKALSGDSVYILVAGGVFRLRANIKLQLGESVMVRMMVND